MGNGYKSSFNGFLCFCTGRQHVGISRSDWHKSLTCIYHKFVYKWFPWSPSTNSPVILKEVREYHLIIEREPVAQRSGGISCAGGGGACAFDPHLHPLPWNPPDLGFRPASSIVPGTHRVRRLISKLPVL